MTNDVAQWKQRIIERKEKGQTIVDWCKEHNVTKGSYNYWRKQVNFAEGVTSNPNATTQMVTFAALQTNALVKSSLLLTWQDVSIQITSDQEAHLAAEVITHLRRLC
jgi:hypothetical protein